MIVVEHVLDGPNGAVQIAFIEFSVLPVLGEIPKLAFGVRQPVAIAVLEMPYLIAAVEILMHVVDQRGNRLRPVAAIGRSKLRLRGGCQR